MSLLYLAQGWSDVALAGLRRVLDETPDAIGRSKLLPAYVDTLLGQREFALAHEAADELQTIAEDLGAPYVRALATHATGTVLLAEDDVRPALAELRKACTLWRELDAPYQVARVRVLIGLACRALGDSTGAGLEFDAARDLFEKLSARPDLDRLGCFVNASMPTSTSRLSPRESEVLALLATGKTNRAIARELFISEKTVARHVSNIFTKLDLSSRAEATAYAYTHRLV
jgi:DNA-binding CsgD family transcriptional regulator